MHSDSSGSDELVQIRNRPKLQARVSTQVTGHVLSRSHSPPSLSSSSSSTPNSSPPNTSPHAQGQASPVQPTTPNRSSPRHTHTWFRKKSKESQSAPTTPRDSSPRSEGNTPRSLTKSISGRMRKDSYTIPLSGTIQIAYVQHDNIPANMLPQLLALLRERKVGCVVQTSSNGTVTVIPTAMTTKIKLKYVKKMKPPQFAVDTIAEMFAKPNSHHTFEIE
jgi:hypothetical protein